MARRDIGYCPYRKLEIGYRNGLGDLVGRVVSDLPAEPARRCAKLERINMVFVDRELRMRELKKRIAELEKKTLSVMRLTENERSDV